MDFTLILNFIADIFLSKVTVLFINTIALYLAFLVLRNDQRKNIKIIYGLMTFLMLAWVDFAYIPRYVVPQESPLSLLLLKIAWFATPLFFYLIFLLTLHLIQKQKQFKILNRLVFIISFLASIITFFTNYIITGIRFSDDIAAIVYGPAMLPFLFSVVLIVVATLYPVFKFKAWHEKKLKHFLFGVGIFYLANTIFNITLPIFLGFANLYFLGDYSTLILLFLIAYGILKHELFNTKMMAAELFTVIIWLALAARTFTSTDSQDISFGIAILFFFSIFGYLLLQSVKKEIEQREEIQEIAEELKKANRRLKKVDQEKSDFLSFATHQLRAPLSGMKNYAAMVLGGSFGKISRQLREGTKLLSESSERLLSLIENLLNSSRIELGRMKFTWSEANLVEMIKSVMQELKSKADNKNIKLIFKTPAEKIPKVKIDEEKIRQVVINLIDNAIKYTLVGKVEVSLSADKNNIQLTITDTGIGIKREDIPHLFKKYSRGSIGHIKGTGLGLYVAKMMAEAHQGKITVESKGEGKGSKMIFVLPIKNNSNYIKSHL
jgi:signal transduction histidine kinase